MNKWRKTEAVQINTQIWDGKEEVIETPEGR